MLMIEQGVFLRNKVNSRWFFRWLP